MLGVNTPAKVLRRPEETVCSVDVLLVFCGAMVFHLDTG